MKMGHIHGRKVCDAVLRKGKVWKGKTMIIHWLPGEPRHSKADGPKEAVLVGTFASARVSKSAVVRNRMRRRIREAMRLSLEEKQEMGRVQLLLCPRNASLDAPFESLLTEARSFLSLLP